MHSMRRCYALALSVVLATAEGVLSVTFPVEMVLTLPIPEVELLFQADKIARAVALAAATAAVGAFLLDADPPNWPLGQRTEYLTEAVEAGKASAAAYAATFEAPKL